MEISLIKRWSTLVACLLVGTSSFNQSVYCLDIASNYITPKDAEFNRNLMATSKFFIFERRDAYRIEVPSKGVWHLPSLEDRYMEQVNHNKYALFFIETAERDVFVTMVLNPYLLSVENGDCIRFGVEFFRARKRGTWRFRNYHLYNPKFWFGKQLTPHQAWKKLSGDFGVSFTYNSGISNPFLVPYERFLELQKTGAWPRLFPYAY